MTSINLFVRPSSRGSEFQGSLIIRLIHNRRVKCITLPGCRLYSREWNKKVQTIVYPGNNPQRVAYLNGIEAKINDALETLQQFTGLLEKQGRYEIEELINLYHQKPDPSTLAGFTRIQASRLERNGQHRTARAYRTVVRGLLTFNKGTDIPLSHLNSCLIRDFEKYLKNKGKFPNTIAYYMRNLRAIYNKAIAEGKIINHRGDKPFAGISTAPTKTMKRALTLEQLQKLNRLNFEKLLKETNRNSREYTGIIHLKQAWLYFFFCFHARGMSFVDLAYLRKENIRGGSIRYCRRKTGQQIEVRLTLELQAIIKTFAHETARSPYLFPIIKDPEKNTRLQYESSMRTQNSRLKKLSRLAGIKQPITTHVARHSWASVGKQENLPLQVLSECLGHSSQNTTLIYLSLLDNRVLDEANDRVTEALKRTVAVGKL